ncbi:MAG: phosphatidylglycerol lysyltransferase domain-containing protein [Candidatus Bathyarchaeota archaeon]|nr:phosphatidylglycerol lysyltransferase domain-containing protein [Candidatus Bathyarchaeota archaeon]
MHENFGLPECPNMRKISIKDRPFLKKVFSDYQPQISEYTFTNLWIWRNYKPAFLSQLDDTILLFREKNEGLFLLPPVGKLNITEIFKKVKKRRIKNLRGFYGISKEDAHALDKKSTKIKSDRDNWDYVYLVENLINLEGSKYRKKRQNINQCLEENECSYRLIKSNIIDDCRELQTEWCNIRECENNPGLLGENKAIKELLDVYDRLGVFGNAIYIDGELEAFTIAESLNENTAVIHFEKANPNIRGLYQLINQWFCRNSLRKFVYVNREQDLGIKGLRRSKEEYFPHHMVEKYLAEVS